MVTQSTSGRKDNNLEKTKPVEPLTTLVQKEMMTFALPQCPTPLHPLHLIESPPNNRNMELTKHWVLLMRVHEWSRRRLTSTATRTLSFDYLTMCNRIHPLQTLTRKRLHTHTNRAHDKQMMTRPVTVSYNISPLTTVMTLLEDRLFPRTHH